MFRLRAGPRSGVSGARLCRARRRLRACLLGRRRLRDDPGGVALADSVLVNHFSWSRGGIPRGVAARRYPEDCRRSPAGRHAALGNTVTPGNGLGVFFKDGFTLVQFLVVFIRYTDGADLLTVPAAGALGKIYESWILTYFRGKLSGIAFQGEQISIGEQFDVQVPADLDQFW